MPRIVVLGNSVALLARPPRDQRGPATYAEMLPGLLAGSGHGVDVVNVSERYLMIDGALEDLERRVVSLSPDLVVINYGIVEAAPRLLPRPAYFYINRPFYRVSRLRRLVSGAAAAAERVLTPVMLGIAPGWRWLAPDLFRQCLRTAVEQLWKECRCAVVVLNIPRPSQRVESLLPGIGRSVDRYNRVINDMGEMHNAHVLDVAAIAAGDPQRLSPDGVHFSVEGHREVAKAMAAVITERKLLES